MKFSIDDFFSKCEQIRRKLQICSHLLKISLMESFIFCAVKYCIEMLSLDLKFMKITDFQPKRKESFAFNYNTMMSFYKLTSFTEECCTAIVSVTQIYHTNQRDSKISLISIF